MNTGNCYIRICPESLDLLQHPSQEPILQFPYQAILCWGHDDRLFQFKVFPYSLNKEGTDPITLCFTTRQVCRFTCRACCALLYMDCSDDLWGHVQIHSTCVQVSEFEVCTLLTVRELVLRL